MHYSISILLFLLCLASCTPKPYLAGPDPFEEDNHRILKSHLSDSLYRATAGRRVKRNSRAVKTESTAFALAKPAFVETAGYNEDILDRLYAINLANGFWIVKGMLPPGYTGGTLVAIIDSKSGELLHAFIWK